MRLTFRLPLPSPTYDFLVQKTQRPSTCMLYLALDLAVASILARLYTSRVMSLLTLERSSPSPHESVSIYYYLQVSSYILKSA